MIPATVVATNVGVEGSPPLVSVGMPAYNAERWIRSAIASILAQDYPNLELIISDNASIDATENICLEIAATDPRVRFYRSLTNRGVDANYNRVVELANGRYFKWAASNDLCAPHFLSSCISVLESRLDVVLCYPRTLFIIDDSGTMEPYADDSLNLEEESPCVRFRRFMRRTGFNNAMNGVIRTETLRQTGLLRFHRSSDVVLVAALSVRGKFVELPENMFFRRMTRESATKHKSQAEVNEYYAPQRGKAFLLFQQWRLVVSYVTVLLAAPVGIRDKICLQTFYAKCIWWMRDDLAKDLWQSLRALVTRVDRNPN